MRKFSQNIMLNKIISNIKSFNYWFKIATSFLSVSFMLAVWLYINSVGNINAEINNIVLFFVFVGVFQYLFTFSFANDFTDLITHNYEENLLLPKDFYYLSIRKFLFKYFIEIIPIFLAAIIYGVFIEVFNLNNLLIFIFLLIISHLQYIFLSISMSFIGKLINWGEYIGFSLRFIGVTWIGAYIPYIFFSGFLLTILQLLPFLPIGWFLQGIWAGAFYINTQFLFISVCNILFWFLVSKVLYKYYLRGVRQ